MLKLRCFFWRQVPKCWHRAGYVSSGLHSKSGQLARAAPLPRGQGHQNFVPLTCEHFFHLLFLCVLFRACLGNTIACLNTVLNDKSVQEKEKKCAFCFACVSAGAKISNIYTNYELGIGGPASIFDPPVSFWAKGTGGFTPSGVQVLKSRKYFT